MAQPARHYINNKAQVNKNMDALKLTLDELKALKGQKLVKGKIYELYARAVTYAVLTLADDVPVFKSAKRLPFHSYNERILRASGLSGAARALLFEISATSAEYRALDDTSNLTTEQVEQLRTLAFNYARLVYALHTLLRLVVETPKP